MLHIITPEYMPKIGGVADYTRLVARGLHESGESVHVWAPAYAKGDPGDRFRVHAELGRFTPADLNRTGRLLNEFPGRRRLLVQWVPHAYGYRSMNLAFCQWLWRRAASGDRVELMVHEPYLALWEGSWRQTAVAGVHRMMTMMLLRAASCVWMSTPAWESKWRMYALGRSIPFVWLPIPSSLPEPDAEDVRSGRALTGGTVPIVGHLGTYGSLVTDLLDGALPLVLQSSRSPFVLLIGDGSEQYRRHLISRLPSYSGRVAATGSTSARSLAGYVAACDLVLQPYPDGISSRRTTAMAALKHGVPMVSTCGHLTEPLWEESKAVRLSKAGDHAALAAEVEALLSSPDTRRRLGDAGRHLYGRLFDLSHTVRMLRMAPADMPLGNSVMAVARRSP
jgi:glycosyltransferase involved in cell wall biosynthesis